MCAGAGGAYPVLFSHRREQFSSASIYQSLVLVQFHWGRKVACGNIYCFIKLYKDVTISFPCFWEPVLDAREWSKCKKQETQANMLKDVFISTQSTGKWMKGNKNILIVTPSIYLSATVNTLLQFNLHKVLMMYLLLRKMRFRDVKEFVHSQNLICPYVIFPLSYT